MKDLLDAVGPSASLVFAAWIFLSFLQTRYIAVFERYRTLVSDYRNGDLPEERRRRIGFQVRQYRLRNDWMRRATNIGVLAAMCLIASLLAGLCDAAWPGIHAIKFVGGVSVAVGLVLVIVAAGFTIAENSLSVRALDDEVADLPEFGDDPAPAP